MVATGRLVQALGGKAVRLSRPSRLASASRRECLVHVLHLPARTLARRKRSRRLSADASDRLLRLARVAARAEDVFGSHQRTGEWLVERSPRSTASALSICSIPTSGRTRSSGSSVASSTASIADRV